MIPKQGMLLILCGTLFLSNLNAQVSDTDITTEFFKIFEQDPMQAFDYAFSTNTWMERNKDGVDNLKNQFGNFLPLVGDYYGYELITSKNIGESFKLVSYMIKYDRQPIRLTFVLYRPNKDWQVQNLKYDDKLDDEIEESANQSRN